MKNKRKAGLLVAVSVLAFSIPLFAHHGNAGYENKEVIVKGTVTQWAWSNPHCILHLDVTSESGEVVPWIVETENPTSMFNIGWSKTSMQPGDQVTVTAMPVKNGKPIGRIVDVLLPNGQKLIGKARLNSNESSK